MSRPEPEVKGSALSSWVRELRRSTSAHDWERIVAALPADTAHLVRAPPLPVEWISYEHSFVLVRTAHDLVYRDERAMAEISRRIVHNDLHTIYRVFIRFASPEFVIERAARLWQTYWRNNGTVEVERLGGRVARVVYHDVAHATPLFWVVQGGTLRGVAEATGVKAVTVRVVEGRATRGVLEVSWREKNAVVAEAR